MNVYTVECEISATLQSKRVTRKSSVLVGANSPEEITVEKINGDPIYIHRLIPRWIGGKLREQYKCTRIIEIKGPIGQTL